MKKRSVSPKSARKVPRTTFEQILAQPSVHRFVALIISRRSLFIFGSVSAVGAICLLISSLEEVKATLSKLTLKDVGLGLLLGPLYILVVAVFVKYKSKIFSKVHESGEGDFLAADRRAALRKNIPWENLEVSQSHSEGKSSSGQSRAKNQADKQVKDLVRQVLKSDYRNKSLDVSSFAGYFRELVSTIEAKADAADEKASILLNKGILYSQGGILFFLVSIVAWQILAWIHQVQTQFIYGVISCSFLFAFIEFLSAWFLRQYRHFVDTSTYLLRVKAILDRYLLMYLAAKEHAKADGSLDAVTSAALNDLLKEPIKWPGIEIFDKSNSSFAKDTIESVTSLVRELRASGEDKK